MRKNDAGTIDTSHSHQLYPRTSTATFDVPEPPLSFWQAQLNSTSVGDHLLVAHNLVARDDDTVFGCTHS